jgi:hypothetical protein
MDRWDQRSFDGRDSSRAGTHSNWRAQREDTHDARKHAARQPFDGDDGDGDDDAGWGGVQHNTTRAGERVAGRASAGMLPNRRLSHPSDPNAGLCSQC